MKSCCVVLCVFATFAGAQERFQLNILHYNDFHARFVETSPIGGVCKPETPPCIGGFARLTTKVRERLAAEPDSLLLNGGDSFQGTIWYNILRWNVTQKFMNILPHDAHVLGNHEFDNGIAGLVPYLQHLKQPVVTANMIDKDEPSLHGLTQPSIVVERLGRKIGIIGVIVANTNILSSTGKVKFTDEATAVKTEAEKLNAKGVKIIIVLSHCGLDVDKNTALHGGPHIDIIVGGHSHTLLTNKPAPNHTLFQPLGPYPVVVEQGERKVLIVQAAALSQFLGEIKLYFDDAGNVLEWEGEPYFLGPEVEQAADIVALIDTYYTVVTEKGFRAVGTTLTELSDKCRCSECNLGNLICDAYLDSVRSRATGANWNYAHLCVANSGSVRAAIAPGVITFASVLMVVPFENNVEVFDLRGDIILKIFEHSAANVNVRYPGNFMVQIAGIRVIIDGALPVNARVVNALVRCIDCDVPRYFSLQRDKYYKIVMVSFLGNGGDGFSMIPDNRQNVEIVGVDYELIIDYIQRRSPILAYSDGRLEYRNPCIDIGNTSKKHPLLN